MKNYQPDTLLSLPQIMENLPKTIDIDEEWMAATIPSPGAIKGVSMYRWGDVRKILEQHGHLSADEYSKRTKASTKEHQTSLRNHRQKPLRLTQYITVIDVQEVLQCSRSTAYRHLRAALGHSGYRAGGILRVAVADWERYAKERFGCSSTNAGRCGGSRSMTKPASVIGSLPGVATKKRRRRWLDNSNELPPIQSARPKTKPRSGEP